MNCVRPNNLDFKSLHLQVAKIKGLERFFGKNLIWLITKDAETHELMMYSKRNIDLISPTNGGRVSYIDRILGYYK